MKALHAATCLALLAAGPARAAAPDAAPLQVQFRSGTASDWIPSETLKGAGIFFHARVDGRDAIVFLYGGPTHIDRTFVPADAAPTAVLTVEAGGLTLHNLSAVKTDAAESLARAAGAPVPLILGENVFDRLIVDIDSAHHRLAFRDPAAIAKPKDAVEVPLVARDGERVVPLSLDGAPPALFEIELGNTSGPLLVTPGYAQAHQLQENRPVSQRLSGQFVEKVVTLNRLGFAGLDLDHVPIAIVPDAALPPPSITGGVGWPLLQRFHLIIDYPHDRLFAIANADAAQASELKDRIGVALAPRDDGFAVTFVSSGSPAEAAGLKIGDDIVAIDGKPVKALNAFTVTTLRFADAGQTFALTLKDGGVRQVKAADFF